MTQSSIGTLDLELCGARTGNCLRAAVALSEAGLPYRVRRMDLRAGEHRAPAFLTLNPAGKVPVLLVHETAGTPPRALSQSGAIMFYADELAQGRLVPPLGTPWRASTLEAFFYFTSDVIALNGIAFSLDPESALAAHSLTQRAVAALCASERFVSDAGYMGGNDFSVADIAAFTIATAMSAQLPWDQLPRLAAWREKIAGRPTVVKGMCAFD